MPKGVVKSKADEKRATLVLVANCHPVRPYRRKTGEVVCRAS